eukprot:264941-Pyramimonas_sp.AAC.1
MQLNPAYHPQFDDGSGRYIVVDATFRIPPSLPTGALMRARWCVIFCMNARRSRTIWRRTT